MSSRLQWSVSWDVAWISHCFIIYVLNGFHLFHPSSCKYLKELSDWYVQYAWYISGSIYLVCSKYLKELSDWYVQYFWSILMQIFEGTVRLVRSICRPAWTASSNQQVWEKRRTWNKYGTKVYTFSNSEIWDKNLIHFQIQKYGTKVYIFKFRDARKTEDKTFVAAPFQPVEPGTEWERWISDECFWKLATFFGPDEKYYSSGVVCSFLTRWNILQSTSHQGCQAVRLQPKERKERERRFSDALNPPSTEADQQRHSGSGVNLIRSVKAHKLQFSLFHFLKSFARDDVDILHIWVKVEFKDLSPFFPLIPQRRCVGSDIAKGPSRACTNGTFLYKWCHQ